MLRNLMLVLAYDGADFHGWQHQPGLRTVQDMLEQSLRRVLRHQIALVGCSRTDSGVHAAGYVANVYTANPNSVQSFFRGIGARLPKDMTLLHLEEAPLTFHATRSAISKLYRYRIHNTTARPCEHLAQRYVYHFWQPLDLAAMQTASRAWVGTHDFSSFASAGNVRQTNVRTIRRIDLYRHDLEIRMDIEGEGFLYKQVRNMMGTLVEIGRGKLKPHHAERILAARNRSAAGPTAPARGLCLRWVRYNLPAVPPPAPDQLELARAVLPPDGALRGRIDSLLRSTAPAPADLDRTEDPCA